MFTTIVRTAFLYILLSVFMRLMGKRQIGQLQPAEFVITILISEIISMPIEDPAVPLLNSLISVCILVALEIIVSVIAMKSERFRKCIQGNSVIVVQNGKLRTDQLRAMRFTVDDVFEALRKKDVFDIADVAYAIAETDGSLSVLLKPDKQNPTNKDLGVDADKAELPVIAVSDGKKVNRSLTGVRLDDAEIDRILAQKHISLERVVVMTVTESGKATIVCQDDQQGGMIR